jgi:hypothetical protein
MDPRIIIKKEWFKLTSQQLIQPLVTPQTLTLNLNSNSRSGRNMTNPSGTLSSFNIDASPQQHKDGVNIT